MSSPELCAELAHVNFLAGKMTGLLKTFFLLVSHRLVMELKIGRLSGALVFFAFLPKRWLADGQTHLYIKVFQADEMQKASCTRGTRRLAPDWQRDMMKYPVLSRTCRTHLKSCEIVNLILLHI